MIDIIEFKVVTKGSEINSNLGNPLTPEENQENIRNPCENKEDLFKYPECIVKIGKPVLYWFWRYFNKNIFWQNKNEKLLVTVAKGRVLGGWNPASTAAENWVQTMFISAQEVSNGFPKADPLDGLNIVMYTNDSHLNFSYSGVEEGFGGWNPEWTVITAAENCVQKVETLVVLNTRADWPYMDKPGITRWGARLFRARRFKHL